MPMITAAACLKLGAAAAIVGTIAAPASLPETLSRADLLAIVAFGLGVGLALGILFVFLRHRGPRWTLRMAGYTVAGCALAAAVWILMRGTFADNHVSYQFVALGAFAGLALGAFRLRHWVTGGQYYARLIAFTAACGAIAGGFASFAFPERYVSTAVMRASPFRDGGAGAAQGETGYIDRLRHLTEDILSRDSLSELIQRPSLDLYRPERQSYAMDDIIDGMRQRDIRITPTPPAGLADRGPVTSFQISFEYADRGKAQAVVRELVTKFTEGNVRPEPDLHREKTPGSLVLEVVESATLPANPVSPNRPAAVAFGLLAGLLLGFPLGALLALRRWLLARQAATPGPRPPYWKYALGAAALGATAASLGSLAIPDRYVSTAVLRMVGPDSQAVSESMEDMFHRILSRDTLAGIISSLQLYARQQALGSLEEAVQQMRDDDLRVAPLPDSPFGGRTTAFRISFEYSDRKKAQDCVHALVGKFVANRIDPPPQRDAGNLFGNDLIGSAASLPTRNGPMRTPPAGVDLSNLAMAGLLPGTSLPQSPTATLEVLDAASTPGAPVGPNRVYISAAGGLAGLLLGIAIAHALRILR